VPSLRWLEGEIIQMGWDQISQKWRGYFVNRLQERYGFTKEEAAKKANVWLQWIGTQPSPQAETLAAKRPERRTSSRPRSSVRSRQSKSQAAGRS
jgi:hypothetical protein